MTMEALTLALVIVVRGRKINSILESLVVLYTVHLVYSMIMEYKSAWIGLDWIGLDSSGQVCRDIDMNVGRRAACDARDFGFTLL